MTIASPTPTDALPTLAEFPDDCLATDEGRAVRELMDRIGDKWTVLTVSVLAAGPLRFGVLRERVTGISQRMLTVTLRSLERDGLVTRTSYPEVPPRVEYALTPLGHSFLEPARAVAAWAFAHVGDVRAAREGGQGREPREA